MNDHGVGEILRCIDYRREVIENLKAFLADYPYDYVRKIIIAQINGQFQ
jgi:ribulose bisphosphate carboxylase small subunit